MVFIAYFTELILQICDYAQNDAFEAKIVKKTLDENFHCHFRSRRKAAKFCHPAKYKSSDQSTVSKHIGQRADNKSNSWGEARQSTDQSTVANHRSDPRRFLFLQVKKLSTSSR